MIRSPSTGQSPVRGWRERGSEGGKYKGISVSNGGGGSGGATCMITVVVLRQRQNGCDPSKCVIPTTRTA